MFDDIYDNGAVMLGKLGNVIERVKLEIKNNIDMVFVDQLELLDDLKELLKEYDKDLIISINYDKPMGYDFTYWTYDDKVKEV